MGSSTSKASRTAGSVARQYPTRTPQATPSRNTAPPPNRTGPTTHPSSSATTSRSAAINRDASDPDFVHPPLQNPDAKDPSFARSLRSLGAVQPNPTLSESSTFGQRQQTKNSAPSRQSAPDPRSNPAIMVLDARARLQAAADEEFLAAGRGKEGRQFLDAYMIRQILVARDTQGSSATAIERKLGLKVGVVARLGRPGVVGVVNEVGRGQREVDMV